MAIEYYRNIESWKVKDANEDLFKFILENESSLLTIEVDTTGEGDYECATSIGITLNDDICSVLESIIHSYRNSQKLKINNDY